MHLDQEVWNFAWHGDGIYLGQFSRKCAFSQGVKINLNWGILTHWDTSKIQNCLLSEVLTKYLKSIHMNELSMAQRSQIVSPDKQNRLSHMAATSLLNKFNRSSWNYGLVKNTIVGILYDDEGHRHGINSNMRKHPTSFCRPPQACCCSEKSQFHGQKEGGRGWSNPQMESVWHIYVVKYKRNNEHISSSKIIIQYWPLW